MQELHRFYKRNRFRKITEIYISLFNSSFSYVIMTLYLVELLFEGLLQNNTFLTLNYTACSKKKMIGRIGNFVITSSYIEIGTFVQLRSEC